MRTIDVNINDYSDVLEKFDNDKLSKELAEFIYEQYKSFKPKGNANIKIIASKPLEQNQKHDLAEMIHAYFGLEVQKMLIVSKYHVYFHLFLVLIGIILIGIANLKFVASLNVFKELFVITGWVVISEVIYDIVFEKFKDKIKLKRYKKLASAKIYY